MQSNTRAMTTTRFIKPIINLVFFSILILLMQSAMALPKAYQANYSVSKGSLTLGNLNTVLKYSGNKYSYHKYTKATGLAALLTGIKITENTDGVLSGQNLAPKNYFFNQARHSKSKIDKISFASHKAIGSYKGSAFQLKTTNGVQDRASLEISLARDLSLNKKQLSYPVISRGERSQFNFQRLGQERISTPAGTFNTVKVRMVRNSKKRETTFWMAKELGYIPVKITHRENDDLITSVIRSYKQL